MSLAEIVSESDVVVDFAPADKWDAIKILVQHMVDGGRIPAERGDELLEAVLERERSMSTGLEQGVAIPHAAVDGLQKVHACVGIVRREEGLSFDSVDGRPARFVVLLLIPRQQKLLHIRTLKEIALLFGREGVRERVLAATTAEAAYQEMMCAEAQE
jgi:PTS system fructose-specific IIA component